MKPRESRTQKAIRQEKPFRSPSQEALISLFLTAEHVRWPATDLLAAHGDITTQQYNVLRILRGAGPGGLPTLEIGQRMIERTPGITRLLDRLEDKGFVLRERSSVDRRLILCRITKAGLALLTELDEPVNRLEEQAFGGLSPSEINTLLRLLERVREDRK